MEVNAVHGQLDRILQVVHLGLGGRLALVVLVAVGDRGQQLGRLIRREAEALQVVEAAAGAVAVAQLVEVAQLRLHGVGAEQGVRDKGARQLAVHDVVAQLQGEQVAGDLLLQDVRLGRIELDLEVEHGLLRAHEALQLLLDFLLVIQPEFHVIDVAIRQAKVFFLDELQVNAYQSHQVFAE